MQRAKRVRGNISASATPGLVTESRGTTGPHRLKGLGYLISTVSVILLTIVSWSADSRSILLTACLLGGAATSVIGMFCRWLSYEIEKRRQSPR